MAKFKMAFLDVGHGDFIFCQTPLGGTMVIDCGSGGIVPSTFLSKIQKIDELQISHPHTDHFDDIVNLSGKPIQSFRCPPLSIYSDNAIGWKKNDLNKIRVLRNMEKSIQANNYALKTDASFDYAVWPSPIINENDPNSASQVTLIVINDFRILCGGDLPTNGWLELLRDTNFCKQVNAIDVFKIPHHGRENAFCKELLDFIKPRIGIISDKPLDKDNENTVATSKYTSAIQTDGGGIEFFGVTDGVSVGKRYVLTTRKDSSIFITANSKSDFLIRTNTTWL